MNVIDEWLDSDGAKRDALKFKNACYIISGRGNGKTAMMNDIFERLKNKEYPNIRFLRQKFEDVDATNAIKEFINKLYGANSFGRAVPDGAFDAIAFAWPIIEQIREEFMMELLYDGYIRAIDYGMGDDCVDLYVRVLANHKDRNNVEFNFHRRPDRPANYTVRFTNPTWDEDDVCSKCREVTHHNLIWQLVVGQNRRFLAMCNEKYEAFVNRNSVDQKELFRGILKAEHRYGFGYSFSNPEDIDGIFYLMTDGSVKFRFEYKDFPYEEKHIVTVVITKEIFERYCVDEFLRDPDEKSTKAYEYIVNRADSVSNGNLKIKCFNCGMNTHNFFTGAIRAYNAATMKNFKSVKDICVGTYITNTTTHECYCVTECYLNPERKEGRVKAYLKALKKPKAVVNMDTWARIVKRYSKEYIKQYYWVEESILYYYIYDSGRVDIPFFKIVEDDDWICDYPHKADIANKVLQKKFLKELEMLRNHNKELHTKLHGNKEEETNEMKELFTKGVFGSKVYILPKDSEELVYAGTTMNMSIENIPGCELTGKIDFIADDEPVKKLQYFNREFIKNVVFNDPATIVEWKDGTKTVVQARDGEKFDPEKGLAMAISKKAMGNKRDYYHVFKHYNKQAVKDAKKKELKEIIKNMPDKLCYDNQEVSFEDFKADVANDLVTFKCSAEDAKMIKKLLDAANEPTEKEDK